MNSSIIVESDKVLFILLFATWIVFGGFVMAGSEDCKGQPIYTTGIFSFIDLSFGSSIYVAYTIYDIVEFAYAGTLLRTFNLLDWGDKTEPRSPWCPWCMQNPKQLQRYV